MPFLLYTYLVTEVLAPFFASLLILCGILFLGRLVPLLDVILDFGIGFTDFVRFSAYILPKLLLFALPMASMIGVIIGFSRMVTDNELIAIKAGGIGLYRMLPPVLLIAAVTAAATAYTATNLIPTGTVASRQLLFQLAKEKIDKGLREKQFSENLGNLVLYVDHVDPETKNWQGVYLSDLRNPETPVTIVARSGRMAARLEKMEITLELEDGSLHRAPDQRTQTILFKKYTVKIPLQNPQTVLGEKADGLDKGSLHQGELLTMAAKYDPRKLQGSEAKIEYYTRTWTGMLIEYHKRLALAAGCFILTMLGLPLALFTRHGRKPMGLPLGLGFFILYYVSLTGASGVCEKGNLPIGPMVWLPNLFFAILTVFFLSRVAREQSSPFLEWLFGLGDSIAALLPPAAQEQGGSAMKLLDRYLFGQFAKNLLLILCSLIAIYLLVDFFERIDNFLEADQGLGVAIQYFLLKIPQIYDQMMPVCILLAGIITMGLLNYHHEFVALKAAGISVSRIVTPLLIGATLITLLNVGVGQWLLPPTISATDRIYYEGVQKKIPSGISRNGRIYYHGRQGIYSFRRPNPRKNHFLDFSYVTWDGTYRMTMLLSARSADWQNGQWTFHGGQRKQRREDGDYAIKLFKTLRQELPETPELFFVPEYKVNEYSLSQLYDQARDAESHGDDNAWVDLHRRLSFIFLGLPLLLLGIPVLLAVQQRRGRDLALAIPVSCGIAFAAWGWWSMAQSLAKTGSFSPALLSWSIHLAASGIGLYFIRRQDQ